MSHFLVTGGNCYLGRHFIERLLANTTHRITALVSPRWQGGSQVHHEGRLQIIPADLTQTLPTAAAAAIEQCDRVWHFAWMRGKDVEQVDRDNMMAINQLLKGGIDPGRFCFISSVAASPEALSVYGRTKWRAMTRVRAAGGVSLVVGLVVDPTPQGPYKLLCNVVRKTPVSCRLTGGPFPVFSVWQEELMQALLNIAEAPLPPGNYRLFTDRPDEFNEVMRLLELRAARLRIPIWLPRPLILTAVNRLKRAHLLPAMLAEKVLGFLFKDETLAATYRPLPGLTFRNFSSQAAALAR